MTVFRSADIYYVITDKSRRLWVKLNERRLQTDCASLYHSQALLLALYQTHTV